MKKVMLQLPYSDGIRSVLEPREDVVVEVFTELGEDNIRQHIGNYDAVILGIAPFTASIVEAAEKLKIASRFGVGDLPLLVFQGSGEFSEAVRERSKLEGPLRRTHLDLALRGERETLQGPDHRQRGEAPGQEDHRDVGPRRDGRKPPESCPSRAESSLRERESTIGAIAHPLEDRDEALGSGIRVGRGRGADLVV